MELKTYIVKLKSGEQLTIKGITKVAVSATAATFETDLNNRILAVVPLSELLYLGAEEALELPS